MINLNLGSHRAAGAQAEYELIISVKKVWLFIQDCYTCRTRMETLEAFIDFIKGARL